MKKLTSQREYSTLLFPLLIMAIYLLNRLPGMIMGMSMFKVVVKFILRDAAPTLAVHHVETWLSRNCQWPAWSLGKERSVKVRHQLSSWNHLLPHRTNLFFFYDLLYPLYLPLLLLIHIYLGSHRIVEHGTFESSLSSVEFEFLGLSVFFCKRFWGNLGFVIKRILEIIFCLWKCIPSYYSKKIYV